MRLNVFALASVFALSACQASRSAAPLNVFEPFSGVSLEAAQQSRAPGVVAAVYRYGALERVFSWGGALCDGAGAANPAAAYEIGSLSKQITAMAIMQLVEGGRIALDAPIARYVSDLPEAWRSVTVLQLLNHTSGVPDYEAAASYAIYERNVDASEVIATVSEQPLDFEPGTQWRYSNTGYYLLSLAVEGASGRSFADYLEEAIFQPLGMENAHLSLEATHADLAQGCKPEGDARIAVPPITPRSTLGAGGVVATLDDWRAWDDAFGEALLPPASWQTILAPTTLADGTRANYGFGVIVDTFRGASRQMHTGQTAGFSAFYARYPEHDAAIAIFANSYGARLGPLASAMALEAIPALSYHAIEAPADPAPEQTQASLRALRQAALGEAPLDLLSEGMHAFAIEANFAPLRAQVAPFVGEIGAFTYLEVTPVGDAGAQRYLYRARSGDSVKYFFLTWREGRLISLDWADQ